MPEFIRIGSNHHSMDGRGEDRNVVVNFDQDRVDIHKGTGRRDFLLRLDSVTARLQGKTISSASVSVEIGLRLGILESRTLAESLLKAAREAEEYCKAIGLED